MQRALAELDFAPGELSEDQYEVTVIIPPEEGFLGVGGVDAVVEVTLIGDEFDTYEPEEEDGLLAEVEEVEEETGPETEEAAHVRAFLSRVLTEMGVGARVRISETPECIRADIVGEDLGVVIGRRGHTLDALEYLAGMALAAKGGRSKRVELDAEGYKERRRRQIERLVLRKADEAVRRGKPVQLPPMTSAERKIVHLILRDRKDVTTASQGREPNRAVTISPAK